MQHAGSIARGAYGEAWHAGGQLAFNAEGNNQVDAAWLRIEGLESYDLIELRIVGHSVARRQFELTSFVIGAALALLGITALFNLGLAISLRRCFFLWHGGRGATVMIWGMVWSQIGLTIYP